MKSRFGRYEVVRRIGVGGMGEAYLAHAYDDDARVLVVVKTILPHIAAEPEARQLFIDEARIASTLKHDNIVEVLDFGRIDRQLFIAMEYVNGQDLAKLLKPMVPVPAALYVAVNALRALSYAHGRRDNDGVLSPVIHRDVSLANILIGRDGAVKLTDFGIAVAAERTEVTNTGFLRGKIRYMPPERLRGNRGDPQTDVFATGMVLHTMLTGRHPLKGMSDIDSIDAIRDGKIPPVGLDPELDQIVATALEPDAAKRYETAWSLATDLMDYAFRHKIDLEPSALTERIAVEAEELVDGGTSSYWDSLGPLIVDETTAAGSVVRAAPASPAPDPKDVLEKLDALAGSAERLDRLIRQDVETKFSVRVGHIGHWSAFSGSAVAAMTVSPDDQWIAVGSVDGRMSLHHFNGELSVTLEGHQDRVSSLEFSGDSKLLLSAGFDGQVRLWDVVTGHSVWTLDGHEGWVTAARFFPNGTDVVTVSWDRTVRVWDTRAGGLLYEWIEPDGVTSCLATAEKIVLGTVGGALRVLDQQRREFENEWKAHRGSINRVQTVKGGFVSAGDDGVAKIWNPEGKMQHRLQGHTDWIHDVASAQPLILTGSQDTTARLWHAPTGSSLVVMSLPGGAVRSVSFNSDGQQLFTGSASGFVSRFGLYVNYE